jgi:hypothetical protein
MEKTPFKFKIVNAQLDGMKLKTVVDFGYGWKEQIIELEDGTTETVYNGNIVRETIELPFLMTAQQVQDYLLAYWSNKYGALDTYYQTLNDLESLKGLTM